MNAEALTSRRCSGKSSLQLATNGRCSPSVGLTELVHGIYRAQTAEARSRRDSFIRELLNDVEVYPYTKETALLAGKIDGEQQSRGIIIPFGDLLIGATALEVGYSMVTANVRHFRLIPGLTVVQL
ncbi:MAG: VapC toxin family PIN domain ribonuclease [Acidobacteria bacterium]|nr:MAG: VapC toxin family PIN domain ribonuclease [Acidobacteriota bacterium]PYU47447.1 MAG: VapC toxin family PIN domain ribonuclease [Acidobacteriota bacterium]PYU66943.1 MAG: VapC toxin family PIN domain ribonuclease [Acidobacteriota bacterium]